MTVGHARPTDAPSPHWRHALAILAAAVLLRLVLAALVPLFPDEAYYWEWSRRLAGGYFDHPPMIAWLIAAGTGLLGETPFAVNPDKYNNKEHQIWLITGKNKSEPSFTAPFGVSQTIYEAA